MLSALDSGTPVAPLNDCESGDSGHDTIMLTADVTLDAALPNITSAMTINGAGYSISGAASYRIIHIRGGSVTIENVTLQDGDAGGSSSGGAIHTTSSGTLTITNSIIKDNTAFSGGGISVGNGTIIIKNSSIYGNRATRGGGGGIYLRGGRTTVLNSSFYDNFADGSSGSGGAIHIFGGTATLTHVTVHDNRATAGGGIRIRSGSLTLRNSIVSGSTSDGSARISDCVNDGTLTPTTGNGNLIQDGACSAEFSGDPGLASSASGSPPYYALLSGSSAIDAVTCDQLTGADLQDQRGNPRPEGSQCDIGAYEGFLLPRSQANTSSATSPTPVLSTGEVLNHETDLRVAAEGGLYSGIQFQRLDALNVGVQSVLDLGFLDGVDVWSYVPGWVEVCFSQSGSIVFLDAATAPRTVMTVTSYTRDGLTCALLDRAGSVILVSGLDPPAEQVAEDSASEWSLSDCMVTTTAGLNFRETPGGLTIGSGISEGATLTALARTEDWFQVDFHGRSGWISAAYVTRSGTCD